MNIKKFKVKGNLRTGRPICGRDRNWTPRDGEVVEIDVDKYADDVRQYKDSLIEVIADEVEDPEPAKKLAEQTPGEGNETETQETEPEESSEETETEETEETPEEENEES